MTSSSSAGYTTLPPIFAAAARASPMSVSHTARSRAAAAASTSGGSQTARGSTDRRGVKPALPEFRHKKDLAHRRNGGGSGGGGSDVASNVTRHTAGATLIASNRKVAAGGGGGSDAKRLGRTGGGSGPGVGNGMHHHLVGVSANSGGRSSSDEATIGADGTVTFGPNLSLLMSSLAVRFDDGHGNNGGGGGGGRRLGDDNDPLPVGSLSFLSSRKRAEAKKREWTAMNALYAKAMEDKTTTKEQTQWFLARFNYNAHPIMHTPAPNTGAGILPPPGMRQAVLQQQQQHQQQQQQPSGLLASPSAAHLAPAPEHAHLLHSSASASYLKSHPATAAADQNHAAVSVEEEPEEYQDEQ